MSDEYLQERLYDITERLDRIEQMLPPLLLQKSVSTNYENVGYQDWWHVRCVNSSMKDAVDCVSIEMGGLDFSERRTIYLSEIKRIK